MGHLGDLETVLDFGSFAERRIFLRSFIKSVDRGDNRVTVHYYATVAA